YLSRVNPDGSADQEFDLMYTSFTFSGDMYDDSYAADVAVEPDGTIVVLGRFRSYEPSDGTESDAVGLARFRPDATVDVSFSMDGRSHTRGYSGNALAIAPDGKIVVAGQAGDYYQTAKLFV